MSVALIESYEVEAYNTAKESENKIHDDEVARKFGFSGGLVPGVDVYAYMTHLPMARWGRDWLEHGTASCRFAKPVYDGNLAVVTGVTVGEALALEVRSAGVLCATGSAGLVEPSLPIAVDYMAVVQRATRAPASPESLKPGDWLGIDPVAAGADYMAAYLADLRETNPIYAEEGLVHPGMILRMANWALGQNVVLGPWIHVGSEIRNFSAARVGDDLSIRARVVSNHEHKGHLFVELDALVVANGRMPVAQVNHTAIYRPRQVANL